MGHVGIRDNTAAEAFRTGTLTLALSHQGRGDRTAARLALRVSHKAGTIGSWPVLAEGAL